jgi:protein-tyrosine-phosphatase
MLEVVGIIKERDFSSLANIFIPFFPQLNNYNGDCSSVAERATVARITGVRFSPFALKKENMKILFICKYNAFRSRIAEEYFKKINRNPKIKAISRGFIAGSNSDAEQQKLAKDILRIDITKRKSLPVTKKELIDADLIIVVANDIPKIMFNYKSGVLFRKVKIWKIKDEQFRRKGNIKRTILAIKRKVDKLNRKLERK